MQDHQCKDTNYFRKHFYISKSLNISPSPSQSISQCLSNAFAKKTEEKNLLAQFNYKSSMSGVCVLTVLCFPCSLLSTRPQAKAGYPRVAPKPSLPSMATGGACHEDAGQGSPVMMKKMVPVQSSRPHPASATMAQQGEWKCRRVRKRHNFLTLYTNT